jgi:hypothetical protein
VGAYSVSSGTQVALAEGLKSSTWTLQSADNESDALTNYLGAVSCSSVDACMAVGTYESLTMPMPHTDPPEVLAEIWNGTKWALRSVASPAGATDTYLTGVSCTSAAHCVAVGTYENSSHVQVTLAEVWNGTTWTVQATPNPNPSSGSVLSLVSCGSATSCVAVGHYTDSTGLLTFAEVWNGTKWKVESTALPAGATSTQLNSVSCSSATACTAVGSFDTSAGVGAALAESWDGTDWTVQTTASPAGAPATFFYGVSCTSASACTAVGTFDEGPIPAALIETWNGTGWAVDTAATPPGTDVGLTGVSCTAVDACTAVGGYTSSSGTVVPLAEAWNGTDWSIQSTPSPSGASASDIVAVSCSDGAACTGVGNYTDGSGVQTSLVETEGS